MLKVMICAATRNHAEAYDLAAVGREVSFAVRSWLQTQSDMDGFCDNLLPLPFTKQNKTSPDRKLLKEVL